MTMSDKPKSGVPQYHAVETEINDNNEPPMPKPKRLRKPKSGMPQYHAVETETNDNEPPIPKPKRLRQWTLPKLIWFWEVVATITSTACIIAVIVIVAQMQDKPLNNWNIIISLNATIAIFITAAKSLSLLVIGACIAQLKWNWFKTLTYARKLRDFDLFDSAARGPLGSLMLLVRIRWLSSLASIGAIVTILALGVDTFAQQVVSFETRDVEVEDGRASFGISNGYNGGTQWSRAKPDYIEARSVDVAMEGAVLRGIYNITFVPDFECGSRCVWNGSYISLGFSSDCQDITSSTLASNPNTTVETDIMTADTDIIGIYNLTTPRNFTFGMALEPMYRTQIKVVAVGANWTHSEKADIIGDPFPSEFLHVVVARRRPDLPPVLWATDSAVPSKYFKELEIVECAIAFYAYHYSQIAATGNQLTMKSSLQKIRLGSNNQYRSILYTDTGTWFYVQEADVQALVNLFESARFSGNMTTGPNPTQPPSGVVLALSSPNISQTFDNMAASMTERLRSIKDKNHVIAQGTTFISVVFVRVRWVWLTLPVCVTLTASLFLFATQRHTRVNYCTPWKTSTVALLYHQVIMKGDSKAVLKSDLQSMDENENIAKRIKARIQ